MVSEGTPSQTALLDRARAGDTNAFDALVAPYRGELHTHCYRMLGSVHDADDAVQEALLGAWRGISKFEGRSSLKAWLYRISTHASIRISNARPTRQLSLDHGPAHDPDAELGEPVMEPIWIEPYPDALLGWSAESGNPAGRYEVRESVELAFVAALQKLPASQRAVVLICDVLAYPAAEAATLLESSTASVNSALQRARRTLSAALPVQTQQDALRDLGASGRKQLVDTFVTAWESADIGALLELLIEDARLSMPPMPVWFDGVADVAAFMARRMFLTPWRLLPTAANGQIAFGCYQLHPGASTYTLGVVNVLDLRGGRVAEITAFLNPADQQGFDLPKELPL